MSLWLESWIITTVEGSISLKDVPRCKTFVIALVQLCLSDHGECSTRHDQSPKKTPHLSPGTTWSLDSVGKEVA